MLMTFCSALTTNQTVDAFQQTLCELKLECHQNKILDVLICKTEAPFIPIKDAEAEPVSQSKYLN